MYVVPWVYILRVMNRLKRLSWLHKRLAILHTVLAILKTEVVAILTALAIQVNTLTVNLSVLADILTELPIILAKFAIILSDFAVDSVLLTEIRWLQITENRKKEVIILSKGRINKNISTNNVIRIQITIIIRCIS